MAITHSAVATAADDPTAEINKGEWNAAHTIETQTILNTHVANAAAIAESKLALAYPTHQALHVASHANGNADALTPGILAAIHHAASAKSALVDADEVSGQDSAASFGMIRSTWTNVKAFLKTYFDTLYAEKTHAAAHVTGGADIIASASTTTVGLAPLATAPAANVLNVLAIANGETVRTDKALFDATNPIMDGSAAPGTSLLAAHRDHVHASDTSRAPLDSPSFTTQATVLKLIATPATVTCTHTGTAIPITNATVEVTTDGDSDEDNGTLANGTAGQILTVYVKAQGNAADSFKITPAAAFTDGRTSYQFGPNPLGRGVTLVYTSAGWCIVGQYDRRTSQVYAALANDTLAQNYAVNSVTKLTVTAARSITTTVPPAGCDATLLVLTSGTSAYVITFSTGFKSTGTLSTGTVSAQVFAVHFTSDGTNLYETGRTAAMAA